jgi:hypothetical protein
VSLSALNADSLYTQEHSWALFLLATVSISELYTTGRIIQFKNTTTTLRTAVRDHDWFSLLWSVKFSLTFIPEPYVLLCSLRTRVGEFVIAHTAGRVGIGVSPLIGKVTSLTFCIWLTNYTADVLRTHRGRYIYTPAYIRNSVNNVDAVICVRAQVRSCCIGGAQKVLGAAFILVLPLHLSILTAPSTPYSSVTPSPMLIISKFGALLNNKRRTNNVASVRELESRQRRRMLCSSVRSDRQCCPSQSLGQMLEGEFDHSPQLTEQHNNEWSFRFWAHIRYTAFISNKAATLNVHVQTFWDAFLCTHNIMLIRASENLCHWLLRPSYFSGGHSKIW